MSSRARQSASQFASVSDAGQSHAHRAQPGGGGPAGAPQPGQQGPRLSPGHSRLSARRGVVREHWR